MRFLLELVGSRYRVVERTDFRPLKERHGSIRVSLGISLEILDLHKVSPFRFNKSEVLEERALRASLKISVTVRVVEIDANAALTGTRQRK